MKIFTILLFFLCLLHIDLSSQSIRTEAVKRDEYVGSNAWQSRVVTRRGTSVNRSITARREISSELTIRKEANQSFRSAREALARKRFIRKEKSKILDESCQKKYNAYVQHTCEAHNDLTHPTESYVIHRNELVILKKQKKEYYELCIAGELFYVLRDSE